MKTIRHLLLPALASLVLTTARADSPFELVASTTGTPPSSTITITAGSSNLIDFTNELINSQGPFLTLQGKAFTATTTFLGVPNAITFDANSSATQVTFTLAPIGFTKVFTGANSDDVNSQIKDFFKANGADVYARFLAAIAKESVVAVTDGNPNAATASFANSSFVGQGLTPTSEVVDEADGSSEAGDNKPRFGGFGIGFNSGQFKAGGFTGSNTDITLTGLDIGLGENVRLVTPLSLSYLTVEGAKVFGAGINFALPIRIQTMNKEQPLSWRVTPLVGLNVRGSQDLASGALLWDAGVINTLDYRVNPKLVICFVSQLTFHKSIAIDYSGYQFDPKINQQILKNGLRFVVPVTRRLVGDFIVIDTRFLKDAAVKQFTTFGGSLAFRTSKSYNLTLGANYDTGSNFQAWSVGLASAWRW